MSGTAIERVFRHDGMVVAGALALLTLLAWLFLLVGAGTGMDPVAMSGWLPPPRLPPALSGDWTPLYWLAAFCMWVVMMVAMMLPSASPMLLLYARVVRRAESRGRAASATASIAAFAAAYLSLWIFSACWPSPLSGGLSISASCRP